MPTKMTARDIIRKCVSSKTSYVQPDNEIDEETKKYLVAFAEILPSEEEILHEVLSGTYQDGAKAIRSLIEERLGVKRV